MNYQNLNNNNNKNTYNQNSSLEVLVPFVKSCTFEMSRVSDDDSLKKDDVELYTNELITLDVFLTELSTQLPVFHSLLQVAQETWNDW